ncbi:heterokaryon incompatibility protein-domain-containing protein [Podospora didyma]|uniref:Heterokaryon incompatibility protein-domain-containing protein n=1 Tax=Podospora didyma TaxID=330526 RepID=A0AAE0TWA2_9PEZI|nr:heterokaryon incompatibility protein-domain-containing protein [Podospora didyma]
MQSYSDTSLEADDVTECLVEWNLDGPHVDDAQKFVNVSRRLRISWTRKPTTNEGSPSRRDKKEEVYFIYTPPAPAPTTQRPHLVGHDIGPSAASTAETPPSPVRSLDTYEKSERLILNWLDTCEHKHAGMQPLSLGERLGRFRALLASTYFGVIDVVSKRLCPLPIDETTGKPARFAALSYVWGSGSESERKHAALWTTRKNVLSRAKNYGLADDWERFPRTIRDAMKLVKDLGEQQDPNKPQLRYIWVDLLCIVQDSKRSWRDNADNMDLIYGNAYFTICAADGDSSDAGLLSLDPSEMDRPRRATITPDLRLLVSKESESIIEASEWNRRAWTFQERILSRRCIVFVGRRVYFQCRQTNWSQDDNPGETGNGMSSAWRISLHRVHEELEKRPIRFYMTSVAAYTGRSLSQPQDILNAFSGVTQLLEWHLCADMHFGLPTSHFDVALLWKPLAGKHRRKPENLSTETNKDWGDLEFPSWSWSGWMHSTADPGKGVDVVYDADFLFGCLTDFRDWLLNHTWIVWYVRDKKGDLRPLWEGPTVPPASSSRAGHVAHRWRGYKSRPRKGAQWVRYLDTDENRAAGGCVTDDYGRHVESSGRRHVKGEQHKFYRLLPDNPFGLRGPDLDDARSYMFFTGSNSYMSFGEVSQEYRPYQPILQFWTLRGEFHIVRDDGGEGTSESAQNGLQRFHVADAQRDRCGTVVLDKTWAEKNKKDGKMCTFIALSEARSFTKEEWDGWTHYIPSACDDSEWCLFYVMLIARDEERLVWERVGLGKVFQAAFWNDGWSWEEILLG